VRAITGRSGGKFYFEIANLGATTTGANMGFATAAKSMEEALISLATGGVAYRPTGEVRVNQVAVLSGLASDAASVGFALDLSARTFWVRVNGGLWNADGSDPATAIGGIDFSPAAGAGVRIHPAVTIGVSGQQLRANLSQATFAYALPSGFAPWG
jgi:hypothetical protein